MQRNIIQRASKLIGVFAFFLIAGSISEAATDADQAWENLSRIADQEGDYARALEYLRRLELRKQADADYRTRKLLLLLKLGLSFYREKKFSQAEDTFLEALNIEPKNFLACKALGYIAYYSQRLEDAREYWQQALLLNPQDIQLTTQWKRLLKELPVENNLDYSPLANFDIRYHAENADYHIYDIQNYLLEANREIGYDFNYYPSRSIVVILYARGEFEQLRTAPEWLGGLYDGKIRLPVQEGKLSDADFKKILWHEYTHALVHDLTSNHCPTWLHEGLAQYEEDKVEPIRLDSLRRAREKGALIPLVLLERSFGFNRDSAEVSLAYTQAYSLANYLIQNYGFWKIRLILEGLKYEHDWIQVLEKEILLPLDELERNWHAHLEEELAR